MKRKSTMPQNKHTPLIHKPWFEFLSSMRFAVSLLTILGIASIIGTILNQNEALPNYVVEFGPFWFEIFQFLGFYDIYSSLWFTGILFFLILSTSLCLIRNVPLFLKDFKGFRLKATEKSLALMKHHSVFQYPLSTSVGQQYLEAQGYSVKSILKENGSTMLAAKKGSANKLGYILGHLALIIICFGGLIDSDILLKTRIALGYITPNKTAIYANEFKKESTLGKNNLSFRGNIHIREGQKFDIAFLETPNGALMQKLPFFIELKNFTVDYYDTGMPKNFVSEIVIEEKTTGKITKQDLRVNHPITIDGITIYQSSFSDGGSPLNFNAWNLDAPEKATALNATSMNQFPLSWEGKEKYILEFGELRVFNIEDGVNPDNKVIEDIRSVTKTATSKNLGPSITYKLRNETGQATEYIHYMTPFEQNEAFFQVTGVRKEINGKIDWVYIPLDEERTLSTFMLFKNAFQSKQMRQGAINKVLSQSNEKIPDEWKKANEAFMDIFAKEGYVGVQKFIQGAPTEIEKDKLEKILLEILHRASSELLKDAQQKAGVMVSPSDKEHSQFVVNAMIAMTNLHNYPSPVYLELTNFDQVEASGLQLTRSPGKSFVYIGSFLLILGIYFMFYIKQKRVWLLLKGDSTLLAMFSTGNQEDLNKDFEQHKQNIQHLKGIG